MSLMRPLEGPVNEAVHGLAKKTLQQNGGVLESNRDELTYEVATEDPHKAGIAEGILTLAPGMFGLLTLIFLLLIPRFVPVPMLLELPIFILVGLLSIEALGQGKQIDVKPVNDE